MFSMLLVAGSGLVGRFIYVKIHYHHYGEMMSVQELQKQVSETKTIFEKDVDFSEGIKTMLQKFEAEELSIPRSGFVRFLRLLTLGRRFSYIKWMTLRQFKRDIQILAATNSWDQYSKRKHHAEGKELITEYLRAVRRASEFRVYVRVFAWWHLLHMPLFAMLVVTATIHVLTVHMY
jgi:hypothetical protein